MMALREIARALSGDVAGHQILAPGPGHSPKDRSLVVFLDPLAPDLLRVHSHAGDDWRVCRDYVKACLGIDDRVAQVGRPWARPAASSGDDDRARIERAGHLWREGRDPRGTIAETYLAARALSLPDEVADRVLRFHPACPFRIEDGTIMRLPAMLALFRDIATDQPCGVHRTALKSDGSGKADLPGLGNAKKMLGRASGAAIKLSPDAEVTAGLGIGEGIETSLAIYSADWRPIWALGSAGAIRTFPVLPGIESLTIFADADPAGLEVGKVCGERWQDAGRKCRIIIPPQDGQDWNDARAA